MPVTLYKNNNQYFTEDGNNSGNTKMQTLGDIR